MDETTRKELMNAGASAVELNSPMADGRAIEIGSFIAAQGSSFVDLGCGRAALCLRTAEQNPQLKVQMFETLRAFGQTAAFVGDMFWSKPPTPILLDGFGELPDGENSLAAMAKSAGWTVVLSSGSTLEEWDEFEGSWIDGVRGVGTVEALAFAEERWELYQTYRGVLGFAWLYLAR